MAAPSVSGITVAAASNSNTEWSLLAVAGADAAFHNIINSSVGGAGIDGLTSVLIRDNGAGVVSGSIYSAYIAFGSGYDITNGLIGLHIRVNNDFRLSSSANSIRIALFSGVGTTEYRIYGVGTSGEFASHRFVGLSDVSGLSETGSFDATNVTGLALLAVAGSTGTFGFDFNVDQIIYTSKAIYEDGELADKATLEKLFNLTRNFSNSYHNLGIEKLSNFYQPSYPIRFNNDVFEDERVGLTFRPSGNRHQIPPSFYSVEIDGASFILRNSQINSAESFSLTATAGASETHELLQVSQFGPGTTTFTESSGNITVSGTYSGRNSIAFNGGESVNNATIDDCGLVTIAGALTSPRMAITNPTGDALQFNVAPDATYQISADGTVNLNFSGTANLTGLTNSGSSIEFDNLTVNNITITVAAGLTYTVADPTTGGGTVTVQEPQNAITLSGIPQVDHALLAVVDLATEVATFPPLSGSSVVVPLDPARNYRFVLDAPGYLAQRVVLAGNTPAFEFNLPNYRALYEAGQGRAEQIEFNYQTFRVQVSDALTAYPFADVFRTIEDYLATEEGILFPYPPVPIQVDSGAGTRNYLIFPYDNQLDTPNPVRIAPDPQNAADPTFTDFVVVLEGSESPLFDIWDFSQGGGRTIRFQTEAVSVGGGGGGEIPSNLEALLEEIQDHLTADELKEEFRYRKFKRGTQEPIYDKEVLKAPTGITFIDYSE